MSKIRNGVPSQSASTAIASRVIPASGPVSSRSSPRIALTSVDFPAFGRPTTAIWIGRPAGSAAPSPSSSTLSSIASPTVDLDHLRRVRKLLRHRLQRPQQVVHPDPVLGRQRHRLAQPELPGLDQPRLRRPPLGLVGDEDHPRRPLAQQLRQRPVDRRHPDPRVDQEEADVRRVHRPLGQRPHPPRQARVGRLLEPRGVDHGEAQRPEPPRPLAQVAGDARLVVDQRQPPADQAVEQRRLADVRAADDGEGEGHRAAISGRDARPRGAILSGSRRSLESQKLPVAG